MTQTQWNGEPCAAFRVTVTVADSTFFPQYWAREFVGTRRNAVRVEYGGSTFYLDDEDGSGWDKVTHGGSPRRSHRNLVVEPGSVEPRAMSDRLTVDTITSDQLDALQNRVKRAEAQVASALDWADELDQGAARIHPEAKHPVAASLRARLALGQPGEDQAAPIVDRPFRSHRRPEAAPGHACTYGERCPNCRD